MSKSLMVLFVSFFLCAGVWSQPKKPGAQNAELSEEQISKIKQALLAEVRALVAAEVQAQLANRTGQIQAGVLNDLRPQLKQDLALELRQLKQDLKYELKTEIERDLRR